MQKDKVSCAMKIPGAAEGQELWTARKPSERKAMAKNTICLWYDKEAESAARFYAETFPNSAVGAVHT